MRAYFRGPDGMPKITDTLSASANFLYHPVRINQTQLDLQVARIGICRIPMEGTCPHGWTLSRLPLPPVLPPPLGPIDLHSETMREDVEAMLDQLVEWTNQHIVRHGVQVRPKGVLIQGHPRLLRSLADVLYAPMTRMSILQAVNLCICGLFNVTAKTESVHLAPTDDGIYELRLISEETLIPAMRFRLSP